MSLFYDESLCLYFVECQRCSVHNFVISSDQEGCTLGKIWGLRILSELLSYSFFGVYTSYSTQIAYGLASKLNI